MAKIAPETSAATLTARQRKWFASVREGLVRDTGKSLEAWAAIVRRCPETTTRGRLAWLKKTYGLGVNRAATILGAAFDDGPGWDDPDALRDALWKDPVQRSVYDRLEATVKKLAGAIVGPRKTVATFSRKVQFAAAKPTKSGLRLALCLDPHVSARLGAVKRSEGFNERLKAAVTLVKPSEVDAEIRKLLRMSWALA